MVVEEDKAEVVTTNLTSRISSSTLSRRSRMHLPLRASHSNHSQLQELVGFLNCSFLQSTSLLWKHVRQVRRETTSWVTTFTESSKQLMATRMPQELQECFWMRTPLISLSF